MQTLDQKVEGTGERSDDVMDDEMSKRVDAAIDGYFNFLKSKTEVPKDLIDKITGSGKAD